MKKMYHISSIYKTEFFFQNNPKNVDKMDLDLCDWFERVKFHRTDFHSEINMVGVSMYLNYLFCRQDESD